MVLGSIDWGDAPSWFGSVAGAAALGFTAFTVRQQTKQLRAQQELNEEQLKNLRLEQKTLAAEVRDRHTAQARRVRFSLQVTPGQDFPDGPESCWYSAEVTNQSDEAVTDVTVDYGGLEELMAARLQPDHILMDQPCVVGPGHVVAFPSQPTHIDRLEEISPTCKFRDAAGTKWILDADHRLTEDTSTGP